MPATRWLIASLPLLVVGCSFAIDTGGFTGGAMASGPDAADATPETGDAPTTPTDANGGADANEAAPPCVSAGDRCPDGTVRVGPSNGFVLYTTPCDLGMVWNGASCNGARNLLPYNDGNDEGGTFVGATSDDNGASNTNLLVSADANAQVAGTQPHRAAVACAELVFGGHDDWYLPSIAELEELRDERIKIGNFDLSGPFYKSSTETHGPAEPLNAARVRFQDGYVYADGDGKPANEAVRCVRRGS